MPPNAYSSTQGGVRSNIGSLVGGLLVDDTTVIPNAAVNDPADGDLTLEEILYEVLLKNRDALFNDVRVGGNLNTECLFIDNQVSIGDTSGSTFQVLQFITKDIYAPNGPDQVIADTSYEIIHDISLSFIRTGSVDNVFIFRRYFC